MDHHRHPELPSKFIDFMKFGIMGIKRLIPRVQFDAANRSVFQVFAKLAQLLFFVIIVADAGNDENVGKISCRHNCITGGWAARTHLV